jgi:glucose/arabinose dehydrogenase
VRGRSIVIIAIVTAALALSGCTSTGATDTLVSIGSGLAGPSGTMATRYARGLKNVSALAFDTGGRLWATTASYADTGKDRLSLITKAGAAPVTVLSTLHTPLGLLWYRGWLYVTSRSRVDAYAGFDGTRFATHRTVLTLPSGVGESNEIVLSPGGRMLMGISASCDHCVPASKYSATIISFRPDGSDLRIYAKRIRAAVGLIYYPGTSDLFVTMNQRDDLGEATPGDWLAVVRQGDDWKFPACYGQSTAACTSAPRPIATLDTHAAVSGVVVVTGQLGAHVGTAALVAEWSDGKVLSVALRHTRTSAARAYAGTVHPFLAGLKSPVPVILHDRAVLVGDWTTGIVYAISAS